MGDIVLDELELHGPSLLVEPDLHLGHLEVEGSGSEAALPEHGGAGPRFVDAATDLVLGRFLKDGEGLAVGEAGGTTDDGASETDLADRPVAPDGRKNAESQTILVRTQAAKAIGKVFRQHRDDPVREINAVAALAGLLVEMGSRLHIVGDIRNMDAHLPTVRYGLHLDGVVKVARIVGIDRNDVASTEILAPIQIGRGHLSAETVGLHTDRRGKFAGEAMLVDDCEHVHAGRTRRPENLGDRADRGLVAVLPAVETGHHLVAGTGVLGRCYQQITREAVIVRHHFEEASVLSQRSHHG